MHAGQHAIRLECKHFRLPPSTDAFDKTNDLNAAWAAGMAGARQGFYEGAFAGAVLGAIGHAVKVAGEGYAPSAKGGFGQKVASVIHSDLIQSMPVVHKILTKLAKAFGLEACFAAGTPILLADGTSKSVELLKVGDVVLSRDEWDEQGAVIGQAVEAVFARTGRVWELRAGGRLIETTGEHPVWVVGRGWVPVKEVQVGDKLGGRSGWSVTVEGVRDADRVDTVYNLRVADYHTYFVGEETWVWMGETLVSSCC